jgi:hypothetical protein
MPIRATEVFTPGAFPEHTYVERQGENLEQNLKDALDTPGTIVALAGPSKSGKTVLVEKVVGQDALITIQGTGIKHPDDLWDYVLDWMDTPAERDKGVTNTGELSAEAKLKAFTSVFGLVKGETEGGGGISVSRARETTATYRRRGLPQVLEEIGGSDFVLLIDDYHYMSRDIQVEVAKSLKEGVRQGLKICTACVIHRGDDVVRSNPELRGRVRAIDINYWNHDDLCQIAIQGFRKLNCDLDEQVMHRFVDESAGSPQLMQSICLNCCFELDLREEASEFRILKPTAEQCERIFERTATATDFRSLVDVLDAGPKTRGTERTYYKFHDKSEGDVYRCVLRAIASDPPRLSFPYDEITRRTTALCVSNPPVGSSVTGSCLHMSKLALERFPDERVIDWDEQKQVLDIPDPYLLFYLRWSGRLFEG